MFIDACKYAVTEQPNNHPNQKPAPSNTKEIYNASQKIEVASFSNR